MKHPDGYFIELDQCLAYVEETLEIHVYGVARHMERVLHVSLRCQIVYLIRVCQDYCLFHEMGVSHISEMQLHPMLGFKLFNESLKDRESC